MALLSESVRRRLALPMTLLSLVAAILAATDQLGHPLRLVNVLTLYFGGLASGVGLVAAIQQWRGR